MVERWFESSLWSSRFIVILAAFFGLVGAALLFLLVGFFQKVAHTEYNGALDMLYLALSITALAVGLFFLGKVGKH